MCSYLVFDLETLPDLAGFRRLNPCDEQGKAWPPDEAALYAAWQQRRSEQGKSDFFPLYLQRVLCISLIYRDNTKLKISSLVDRDGTSEGRIVQQFFRIIEKHAPQLISWNGEGFDLPVLHYRGLIHGVQAPEYWDSGEFAVGHKFRNQDRRFNHYLGRYHSRHLDLMDVLAKYQGKNNAPMDALAKLCGFAGKLGMDGSQVYAAWRSGQLEDIRGYCETDVMNTWLLFCRFQKMRGLLHESEYQAELSLARTCMEQWAQTERSHLAAGEPRGAGEASRPVIEDETTQKLTSATPAPQPLNHWDDYLQHWPQ